MAAGSLGVTNGIILDPNVIFFFIADAVLGRGEAMRRRNFIAGLASISIAWPRAARSRQDQVRRIGVLMGSDPSAQSYVSAFRDALTQLGWAEGNNLRTEARWGAGDADKIRSFAKELVDLQPDVIVGQSTAVVVALVRETQTIPIVFVNVADPIGSGFVVNLARPGGNLTGFMTDNSALGGKWVELLKEIAPRTARVALMFNPTTAVPVKFYMPSVQAAASTAGVAVNATPVLAKDEIEGVIATQARDQGGRPHCVARPLHRGKSRTRHFASCSLPPTGDVLSARIRRGWRSNILC
jgi:putative ABC transport system substrate-binding protein